MAQIKATRTLSAVSSTCAQCLCLYVTQSPSNALNRLEAWSNTCHDRRTRLMFSAPLFLVQGGINSTMHVSEYFHLFKPPFDSGSCLVETCNALYRFPWCEGLSEESCRSRFPSAVEM